MEVCHLVGDRLWLQAQTERPFPPELARGSEVDLYTWLKSHGRIVMRGSITSLETDPQAIVSLRITQAVRIQERQYFRVPCLAMADEAAVLRSDGQCEPLTLQVLELSAGGLRARSSLPLSAGERLEFRFSLPGRPESLSVQARVTRLIQRPRPAEYAGEVGVTFVELDPEQQELMIHYALQTQLEQRRRGAL
jgi:hypothetical protein